MMGNTKVRETMTADPTAVETDRTVAQAAEFMAKENVGSLPVTENGELVGIVTDRDLVVQVVARGLDPNSVNVADVYTEKPVVATPDEPLDQALQRMAEEQVRRLPVVSDGRLVGILAQADVARSADAESTGHMVEEISQEAVAVSIIGWIILGLLAGVIAKKIMPGGESIGIILTTLLGIVGALLGGLSRDGARFRRPDRRVLRCIDVDRGDRRTHSSSSSPGTRSPDDERPDRS